MTLLYLEYLPSDHEIAKRGRFETVTKPPTCLAIASGRSRARARRDPVASPRVLSLEIVTEQRDRTPTLHRTSSDPAPAQRLGLEGELTASRSAIPAAMPRQAPVPLETTSPTASARGRSVADRGSPSGVWTGTAAILAAIVVAFRVFGARFTTASNAETTFTITAVLAIGAVGSTTVCAAGDVVARAEVVGARRAREVRPGPVAAGALQALRCVQGGT